MINKNTRVLLVDPGMLESTVLANSIECNNLILVDDVVKPRPTRWIEDFGSFEVKQVDSSLFDSIKKNKR